MLVLSRRRSERILVGTSIQLTVVKLDGNQVRLGIEAPPDVAIVRAELLPRQPGPLGGGDATPPLSRHLRGH